jgi:PIN domain nuclease of toxin-antitoxin system
MYLMSRCTVCRKGILCSSKHRSAASGWEMAIKARLGKLDLPGNLEGFIQDPFDRMLIAQAQVEKLSILTADPQLGRYEVETIW